MSLNIKNYLILIATDLGMDLSDFIHKSLDCYYNDYNIHAYTACSIDNIMSCIQENFYDLIDLYIDADSIYGLDALYDDMYLDLIKELQKNAEVPIYKTYKTIDGEISLDLCIIAEHLVLSDLVEDFTANDINQDELTDDSFNQLKKDLIPIIAIFTGETD